MRNAVIMGIKIPLPSPEKNCIPHKKRSVRVNGLAASSLFSTGLLGEDATPRTLRKTIKKTSMVDDSVSDKIGGRRSDTLSERKPPTKGAAIPLIIQDKLNIANDIPLISAGIKPATMAFRDGIQIL